MELVAWTIIGVLMNVSVTLSRTVQTRNYDPELFLLTFPRLFTAPIMAIVVVALFAAGLTGGVAVLAGRVSIGLLAHPFV